MKLSNLDLVGNTAQGVIAGDNSQVSDCEFSGNGEVGLLIGASAVISDSTFQTTAPMACRPAGESHRQQLRSGAHRAGKHDRFVAGEW